MDGGGRKGPARIGPGPGGVVRSPGSRSDGARPRWGSRRGAWATGEPRQRRVVGHRRAGRGSRRGREGCGDGGPRGLGPAARRDLGMGSRGGRSLLEGWRAWRTWGWPGGRGGGAGVGIGGERASGVGPSAGSLAPRSPTSRARRRPTGGLEPAAPSNADGGLGCPRRPLSGRPDWWRRSPSSTGAARGECTHLTPTWSWTTRGRVGRVVRGYRAGRDLRARGQRRRDSFRGGCRRAAELAVGRRQSRSSISFRRTHCRCPRGGGRERPAGPDARSVTFAPEPTDPAGWRVVDVAQVNRARRVARPATQRGEPQRVDQGQASACSIVGPGTRSPHPAGVWEYAQAPGDLGGELPEHELKRLGGHGEHCRPPQEPPHRLGHLGVGHRVGGRQVDATFKVVEQERQCCDLVSQGDERPPLASRAELAANTHSDNRPQLPPCSAPAAHDQPVAGVDDADPGGPGRVGGGLPLDADVGEVAGPAVSDSSTARSPVSP